jgi:DNA-binding transcriptional regulator YhcF (GntR family)
MQSVVLAASQHGCMINTTDRMYSKLPPEDEQLIYSKHVEDIYWNKLRKKVHLVGS